jgi:uncharacterized protein YmfQ (DUF2313 family)
LIGNISGLDDVVGLSEPDSIDADDMPFSKYLSERREVHSSQATRVYQARLDCAGQTRAVFVKHFHARSVIDQYKQLVRKSRAMKAVMADALLNEHGFIAPELLIIAWQQNYGIKKNYVTVSTALEGYKDIYQQVEALSGLDRMSKKEFLVALATATAALHKANISHGDMRPGNILCQHGLSKQENTWQFAYIDNERTKKHWRLPTRARIKNLVQLNLLISQEISRSDRLRFFQTYCDCCYGSFNKKLLVQVLKKTRTRMARLLDTHRIQQSDVWL